MGVLRFGLLGVLFGVLLGGLSVGLSGGLSVVLLGGLVGGLVGGLSGGLVGGLIIGIFFGISGGLMDVLSGSEVEERSVPGEGIQGSSSKCFDGRADCRTCGRADCRVDWLVCWRVERRSVIGSVSRIDLRSERLVQIRREFSPHTFHHALSAI